MGEMVTGTGLTAYGRAYLLLLFRYLAFAMYFG
jgi:hypothetical protein